MSDRSHHWMARLQTPDGPRGYESCGPRNSVPRTVLKASTVMPRDRSMPLTPDGRRGETDQASQHKTNFCSMAVGPQTVARFFLYSHFALSFLLEGHKRLKWNEQIIHSLIDWMNNLITHLYVVNGVALFGAGHRYRPGEILVTVLCRCRHRGCPYCLLLHEAEALLSVSYTSALLFVGDAGPGWWLLSWYCERLFLTFLLRRRSPCT